MYSDLLPSVSFMGAYVITAKEGAILLLSTSPLAIDQGNL